MNAVSDSDSSNNFILLYLSLLLYPLNPLNLVPLIIYLIRLMKLRIKHLTYIVPTSLAIVLTLVSLVNYFPHLNYIYLTCLTAVILLIIVKEKSIDRLLASLTTLVLVLLVVNNSSYNIYTLTTQFTLWVEGRGTSLLPLYVILLANALVIALVKFISRPLCTKGSLSSKSPIFTPQAIPTLLFITLLISAATLLAMGKEAKANKLAELAYYSLVMAVCLAIYDVVKSGKEDGGG